MKAPTSALCLCLWARARARLRARMSCHPGCGSDWVFIRARPFANRIPSPWADRRRPKRSMTGLVRVSHKALLRARVEDHLRARPHEASRLGQRSQQRRLGKRGVPCVPGTRFSSEWGVSRGPACWGRGGRRRLSVHAAVRLTCVSREHAAADAHAAAAADAT